MTPSHPCPNCSEQRSAWDASCDSCGYPKHARAVSSECHRPATALQFHLCTIFAAVTIAAVVFAILRAVGYEGLWFAIEIGAAFVPLAHLIRAFHKNPIA